ncbi:hypothetical protein NQ318_015413 [Aromia moschata]|uniref:Uncharacterized protein n=1 Tax=Aromia moschata TaxID=1265417 RepID=A0AAV8YPW2_9CUCU|nr:hypothetical protein NQ318_015413 [Aromia moschata]
MDNPVDVSAVQHERGPRKPKLQPPPSSQMHQSPSLGHGLQHMPSGDKLPTGSASFHFGTGLFAPPHHPLKALTLPPPPPPVSSSPTSHLDTLSLPIFHPPALPPPPGLLHILMSAEKCQYLLEELKTSAFSYLRRIFDNVLEKYPYYEVAKIYP